MPTFVLKKASLGVQFSVRKRDEQFSRENIRTEEEPQFFNEQFYSDKSTSFLLWKDLGKSENFFSEGNLIFFFMKTLLRMPIFKLIINVFEFYA